MLPASVPGSLFPFADGLKEIPIDMSAPDQAAWWILGEAFFQEVKVPSKNGTPTYQPGRINIGLPLGPFEGVPKKPNRAGSA